LVYYMIGFLPLITVLYDCLTNKMRSKYAGFDVVIGESTWQMGTEKSMKTTGQSFTIFSCLSLTWLVTLKTIRTQKANRQKMARWTPICHVLGEHEHKSNTHDINDTVFKHRIHDISVAILGILHDWFSSSYHCSIRLFDEQNEVEVCGVWCHKNSKG
jgi:hypothetical protein